MNSPRSVGAQYATGEQWRNNSRKNERMEPKQKQYLAVDVTKIMASGPIASWEIDGETVATVSDFILGAPKSLQMVTAAMK